MWEVYPKFVDSRMNTWQSSRRQMCWKNIPALPALLRTGKKRKLNPIEIDGQQVKPISLTSRLLFDQWILAEGEKELTVMQVVLEGQQGKDLVKYQYDLLDRFHPQTRVSSMARTTGYTCTIVARQLLRGMIPHKGICPPEFIGQTKGCFKDLLEEYGKRQIYLRETVTRRPLNAD